MDWFPRSAGSLQDTTDHAPAAGAASHYAAADGPELVGRTWICWLAARLMQRLRQAPPV